MSNLLKIWIMRKEEIRLTPEQALELVKEANRVWTDAIDREEHLKLTEPIRVFKRARTETRQAMYKFDHLVTSFVAEPNAEKIYALFIDNLGNYAYQDEITEAIGKEPYAGRLFMKMMNHPHFRRFDEDGQVAIFSMPNRLQLLEKCFSLGHDLCDDGEVLLFNIKNCTKIVEQYLSIGFGLCHKAQKKMMELPERSINTLLTAFVNSITEKNYSERTMCTKMQFALISPKNKSLFTTYCDKMRPFYKSEQDFQKAVFAPQVLFVAKQRGWLS